MRKLAALLVGAALMMETSAMATPISGSIDFTGSINLMNATGIDSISNPVSVVTATGINFIDDATSVKTGSGAYLDFSAIPQGTDASYTDFYFKPTMNPTPVDPLWTINYSGITYSFKMTSVSSEVINGQFLILTGKGLFNITGNGTDYEETYGDWLFSTQDNGQANLTFSASSTTVPEPGTMMLLGLGIFGLAIFGKRRMNKDA